MDVQVRYRSVDVWRWVFLPTCPLRLSVIKNYTYPSNSRQVLEKYLSSTSVRPHERNKEVTIVDSTRDWPKPHFTEGIKISSFALRLLFP